jgi:hypothetical protein
VDVTALKLIDLSCPACGRNPVRGIHPSVRGTYCQCESCHHLWLQEDLTLTNHASAPAEKRRSTDRGDQDQCPYCGLAAEVGHVCPIPLLERRIAELEAENAQLRNSAQAFGDLAERLNKRLAAETRTRLRRRGRTAWDRRSKN